MVLVVFDCMRLDILESVAEEAWAANSLEVNLSVAGFVPSSYEEVMGFISQVFDALQELVHSIGRREGATRPDRLLSYLVEELSRKKKLLAVTPEDTHYDEPGEGVWQTAPEVAFFVDRGSPYRHVFSVQRVHWAREVEMYLVLGRGFNTSNMYELRLNFLPDAESLSGIYWDRWLAGELLARAEALAQDKKLHFGVYPGGLEECGDLRLMRALLLETGLLEVP
jgi:hypothetical protein